MREVSSDAYVILEHFAEGREEEELAKHGMMLWDNRNHPYAQAAMGWQQESGFGTPPRVSWVTYMESHDEERIAYKQKAYGVPTVKASAEVRRKRLETNAAFFFLTPGPKLMWQYGEVGYDHSINENGRTGRKPIFTKSKMTEPQRTKLARTYGELIRFRLQYESLFEGNLPFSWQVQTSDWQNGRYISIGSGYREIRVVGNYGTEQSLRYEVPASGIWRVALTNQESLSLGSKPVELLLAPGEFALLTNF